MTTHRRLQIWTGKERRHCQRFIRDQHSQGIYGITVPELRRYRRTERKHLVRIASGAGYGFDPGEPHFERARATS